MTTLVLIRYPHAHNHAEMVRAICNHLGRPASSETRWDEGAGDIHIDLGTTSLETATYVAELYLLPVGVAYRIEGLNGRIHTTPGDQDKAVGL